MDIKKPVFNFFNRFKTWSTSLQKDLIFRRNILQRYRRLAISFGLIAPAIVTSRNSLAQQSANHLCGKQTPSQMQGPFFMPLLPELVNLVEPKMKSPRMRLTGLVVDTACRPIPGAMLDFCQVDGIKCDTSKDNLINERFGYSSNKY
jgi:hypothetical protein